MGLGDLVELQQLPHVRDPDAYSGILYSAQFRGRPVELRPRGGAGGQTGAKVTDSESVDSPDSWPLGGGVVGEPRQIHAHAGAVSAPGLG